MFEVLLPRGSSLRKFVKAVLILFGWQPASPYTHWMQERKDKIGLHQQAPLRNSPLISIIVPAFNTPDKYLQPCVMSVVAQTYQNWELVLVDASSDSESQNRIAQYKFLDDRITIVRTINKGISANTNKGIEASRGEYIGFMDHDDVLEESALYEVARAINEEPDAGLVYTDEDKLSEDGSKYLAPHFKPDWSPHLLNYVNYITHFVVVRRDLVDRVGGLDPGKDGAQDFDFLLKVTDQHVSVRHIPKVLYHWRIAKGSTAESIANKPYVLRAGVKALEDHYRRIKVQATPSAIPGMPGFYKVVYHTTEQPTVIVMPFANPTLIKKYLHILGMRGLGRHYRTIVPYETESTYEFEVCRPKGRQSFLDDALSKAGKTVVIIGDFVLPEADSWATELTGVLCEKRVHAVSPIVVQADRRVIDAGIVWAGHKYRTLFRGFQLDHITDFGNPSWPRDVDALSGLVVATRTADLSKFLRARAGQQSLLLEYSRTKPEGSYNVTWSNVVMVHVKARPAEMTGAQPFYNSNLHPDGEVSAYAANDQQLMDALLAVEQGDRQ